MSQSNCVYAIEVKGHLGRVFDTYEKAHKAVEAYSSSLRIKTIDHTDRSGNTYPINWIALILFGTEYYGSITRLEIE